jgi:hypothetical protein
MRKSILVLIYSLLFTFFPLIMYWYTGVFSQIKAYDSNGMNWGMAYYLALAFLMTLLFGITGSVFSWIGYRKNDPSMILYATGFMGTIAAIFYPFPSQTIPGLVMVFLGLLAYFDLKRILKKQNQ